MVTASHNPPQDNGYKVYAGDGAQIVPPADREIEAAIHAVGLGARRSRSTPTRSPCSTTRSSTPTSRRRRARRRRARASCGSCTPRCTASAPRSCARCSPRRVRRRRSRCREQEQPDPDFPTVAFPNPEEPGALDLALALARERDADIVIANDPDADRCAVAVPPTGRVVADAARRRGGRAARRRAAAQGRRAAPTRRRSCRRRCSRAMAERHGVGYAETLTGFKWISRAAPDLVFGYEEALGYAVAPDLVRDKDGISAALLVAELAARAEGRRARRCCSAWTNSPPSTAATPPTRCRCASRTSPIIADDDAAAARRPAGDAARRAGHGRGPAARRRRAALACAGGRVVVRPSGTEPKLKAYLEVVEPAGVRRAAARPNGSRELRAEISALALSRSVRRHRAAGQPLSTTARSSRRSPGRRHLRAVRVRVLHDVADLEQRRTARARPPAAGSCSRWTSRCRARCCASSTARRAGTRRRR